MLKSASGALAQVLKRSLLPAATRVGAVATVRKSHGGPVESDEEFDSRLAPTLSILTLHNFTSIYFSKTWKKLDVFPENMCNERRWARSWGEPLEFVTYGCTLSRSPLLVDVSSFMQVVGKYLSYHWTVFRLLLPFDFISFDCLILPCHYKRTDYNELNCLLPLLAFHIQRLKKYRVSVCQSMGYKPICANLVSKFVYFSIPDMKLSSTEKTLMAGRSAKVWTISAVWTWSLTQRS